MLSNVLLFGWTREQYLAAIEILHIHPEECETLLKVKDIWRMGYIGCLEGPPATQEVFDKWTHQVYVELLNKTYEFQQHERDQIW